MKRVLLDLTPLRSHSGLTGIGRYIFELVSGLADTESEWRGALDIIAVGHLPWRPSWHFEPDLRKAAVDTMAARGSEKSGLVARRRFWLGPAAHAARANLLHVTEALGTPLLGPLPKLVTCYDVIPLVLRRDYLGVGAKGRVGYAQRFVRDFVRYRTARRIVAISERSRSDVVRVIGVDPARAEAIVTGIDLERFLAPNHPADDERIVHSHGLGARPFALYVGAGDPRKNAEGMCAALAHASRSVDLELAWAGDPAPKQRDRAMQAARRHGVSDRIRWLGFVPDDQLSALYRAAVCHLFLSRLEGFGLTVVEAMASGCPVIVARDSGADELVSDAGMVVSPDDAAAAGEHLVRLTRDPALRADCVARGRARVPLFDRKQMARGYVAAYQRALAEP